MSGCFLLPLLLLVLACCHLQANALSAQATFNQRGVQGTVNFSQDNSTSPTVITLNLTGLEAGVFYPWHVHQYPFPLDSQENPCRGEVTGGHYDPLGANYGQENYSAVCLQDPASCEAGDLSGKFGNLSTNSTTDTYSDPNFLALYGTFSVIGRSIVIHRAGDRYVCANILYPTSFPTELLFSSFQRVFAGSIYFTQHTSASTSAVYVDLLRIDGTTDSAGHNWHVHSQRVAVDDPDCMSIGPHYNPHNVSTGGNYSQICGPDSQSSCEVGDLSGKSMQLSVGPVGATKLLYTDTDLTLTGADISIVNRSVAIHQSDSGAPIIGCSSIEKFRPLRAVAVFDEAGVSGRIDFTQESPFEETEVYVSLTGLGGIADGYHVHEYPVGPGDSGSARCNVAGGHWNPHNVSYTSPTTSDDYEVGDLSGKFGGLAGRNNISEVYYDPNIPLFGRLSVIGRSIVIHYQNTSRWICANIEHSSPTVTFSSSFNASGFSGQITFVQPADNPLADTIIIVEADLMPEVSQETVFPVLPTVTPSRFFSVPSPSRTLPSPTTPSPSVSNTTSTDGGFISATFSSGISSTSTAGDGFNSSSAGVQPQSTPTVSQTAGQSSSSSSLPPLTPQTSSQVDVDTSTFFFMPEMTVEASTTSQVPSTTGATVPASLSFLLSPTPSASNPPVGVGRRKRLVKRQQPMVGIRWDLRSTGGAPVTDCNALPVFNPSGTSSDQCSPSSPLACRAGDLTSKHGTLGSGSIRAVFTDPNLPLSGPNAVFGPSSPVALLIQPMNNMMQSASACAAVMAVVPPPPPSSSLPPLPSSSPLPPPSSSLPPSPPVSSSQLPVTTTPKPVGDGIDVVLIGAVVGGVGGAILIVALVIIVLVCCLKCRRGKYDVSKAKMKGSSMELGYIEPRIGDSNFRVLFNYSPQTEGDIALTKGDMITLLEAPKGGGWWKGRSGEREGWFPKSYVELVDTAAERKKQKDDNFKLAAAAIVVASSSFSARHGSLSTKRSHGVEERPASRSGRKNFSKGDIDSTPKMVAKLYHGEEDRLAEKEKELQMVENAAYASTAAAHAAGKEEEGVVIENVGRERGDSNNSNRAETPKSIRASEIIANPDATELSQESANASPLLASKRAVAVAATASADDTPQQQEREAPEREAPVGASDTLLPSEMYIAKYDFSGSTDLELALKKGDRINVIEKADNGWWRGVCDGRVGWFPESYVRAAPTKRVSQGKVGMRGMAEGVFPRSMAEMMSSGAEELEASEYRALFSYRAGGDGDLTFREGDTVLVYWANDSGWWYGGAGSELGWFPGSYVEPIIEVSEAGSLPASPTSEATGGMEQEIATAIEKRKTRKKWSFRTKKRKSEEVPPEREDALSPLLPEEPAGLKDEFATALLRKVSSVSSSEEKQLTIDERIEMIKRERRESEREDTVEQSQTELMLALSRRQERLSGAESPIEMPGIKEETELEAKEQEKGAPDDGDDDDVFTTPVVPSATGVEKVREERKSPDGQEAAETEVKETPTAAPVDEPPPTEDEKPAVTPSLTEGEKPVIHPSVEKLQETGEGRPPSPGSPGKRRSRVPSDHQHKPRRVAPPPPTNVKPISRPTTPLSTPQHTQVPDEVKEKPVAAERKVKSPPQVQSPKGKEKEEKKQKGKPEKDKKSGKQKKTDKRKFTVTERPSKSAISMPVAVQDSPTFIPKSLTLAGPQGKIDRHRQQRTTATGIHKTRPRRRPPPPPPQAATAGGKQVRPAQPVGTDETDSSAVAAKPTRMPSVKVATPLATVEPRKPVAPVRMRPRMQRVKRPVTRFIPPPPSIPLPPPPPRRKVSLQVDKTTPASGPTTSVPENVKPAKPPVQPKPAHLGKRSTSETSNVSSAVTSPTSDGSSPTGQSRMTKERARPPPPLRTSSLSDKMGLQVQRVPAVVDETDSPKADERSKENPTDEGEGSGLRGRADPPKNPPPRRPLESPEATAAEAAATQANVSQASGEKEGPSGTKIRPKGSSLVRSLKRIVRHPSGKTKSSEEDSSKQTSRTSIADDKELEQSGEEKAKQPPTLPSTSLERNGSQLQGEQPVSNGSAVGKRDSPVPKPRTKLTGQQQPSLEEQVPSSEDTSTEDRTGTAKNVPPRPPPPTLSNSPNVTTSEQVEEKPIPLPRSSVPTDLNIKAPGDESLPTRSSSVSPLSSGPSSPSKHSSSTFFRATRDYSAQRANELSFSVGDILIEIDRPEGEEKFRYGMLDDGSTGLFPISCIEPFRSLKS